MIKLLSPMTHQEWQDEPNGEGMRYFVPWEEAQQGEIKELPEPKDPEGYKYFTDQRSNDHVN